MRKLEPEIHAEKRRQILDAAAICFAEKGFEATRTADICHRAKISSGKLFHYFKSKRDVFIAIFAQGQSDDDALLEGASGAPDTVTAIIGFFQETISNRNNPVLAGLLFEAIAFARRDKDFAQVIDQDETHMRDELVKLVQLAISKGEAGSGGEPSQVADWLMALHDLAILRAASDQRASSDADRRMIAVLVRAILNAAPSATSGEKS